MPPVIPGYNTEVIGVAYTPGELNQFVSHEQSLPDFTRLLIEIPLDPSQDIHDIAQQINYACAADGMLPWPEYPNNYAFVEGNILYVAYAKAPPGSLSPHAQPAGIITIILVIGALLIVGPILISNLVPGFGEIMGTIRSIVPLIILLLVMRMIGPLFKS